MAAAFIFYIPVVDNFAAFASAVLNFVLVYVVFIVYDFVVVYGVS